MLEAKLLGRFEIRLDGRSVEIASRPAQSLLAYLMLRAGTPHRREQLAGLFWPDVPEQAARRNLRYALWRIRKAIENSQSARLPPRPAEPDYILADDIVIAFKADSAYWLDVALLDKKPAQECAPDDLISAVSAYGGDLLPGFYDEWAVLERERLQIVFEKKMKRLLDCLVEGQRWADVLEWGERWITLGHTPELAYRALMFAHASHGDLSSVAATYHRCQEALRQELGVEPSEQTRAAYEQLTHPPAGSRTKLPTLPFWPAPAGSAPVPVPSEAPPAPGIAPFKGLQAFDEADADWFFGRQVLTNRLVERATTEGQLLIIVGASGSGKSSIVRAGLVPALKRIQWSSLGPAAAATDAEISVLVITPTAHPLETLAAGLTREAESVTATATLMDDLARDPRSLHLALRRTLARTGNPHACLVVDQFEELFTLCRDEAERLAFVDNLTLAASAGADAAVTLIIALRADFYAHCAQYAGLREALVHHQEYLGPMTAEELRQTIEAPAQRGNWIFEPGLVDLILRDAGSEPGSLPLLSHALLETWRRRQGRTLTLAGYAESGGVHGAIAKTAESTFQRLTPNQQKIARNIFLRLTQLGEDLADQTLPAADTRRRVALAELVPEFQDAETVRTVVRILAEARLVTLAEATIEVAHEALIREWPTLRQWLKEDREGLRLHRHLTEAAQAWDDLERDPGEVYRGARLAQASEWARAHTGELNALESAFLEASQAAAERETAEREAQQQRDLAAARLLAEAQGQRAQSEMRRAEEQARTAQQLRRRAVYLAAAVVMAGALAVMALVFGELAQRSAQQANQMARLARSREWAAAAIANLDTDPERSILLALQAVQETYGADQTILPEAEGALHQAVLASRIRLTLAGHTAGVQRVTFSPDGRRLATISLDRTAKVWSAARGQLELTLLVHGAGGSDIAFSPDGTRLATAGLDSGGGAAKLWDAATGQQLLTLGATSEVSPGLNRVVFNSTGTYLATAGDDGVARIWEAQTGRLLLAMTPTVGLSETSPILGIAFSPDGTRLATANAARADSQPGPVVTVWDTATGQAVVTLTGEAQGVNSVIFSPDGKLIATTSDNGTAKLWEAATGHLLHTLFGHTAEVEDAAFSPDGTRLATASLDRTAKVWEVASGRNLLNLVGHSAGVRAVTFSPDGTRLATASQDGTARVWDITPEQELVTLLPPGPSARLNGLAFSPDGRRIAAASADGTVKVWQMANSTAQDMELEPAGSIQSLDGAAPDITGTVSVNAVAFSPDGQRLAIAGASSDLSHGAVVVREVASGKKLFASSGPRQALSSVSFSPDGAHLAAAGLDKTVDVWDAATGQEVLTLSGHSAVINAVAFSPSGTYLATGSQDGSVKIWNVAAGVTLLTLTAHQDSVWSLAFSPTGKQLATGSRDGTLKIWDPVSGQLFRTLTGNTEVHSLAFSPDGARLATGNGDKTTSLWDVASGEPLYTLYGPTDVVSGVAFSPDGTRLATASYDGKVRLYVLRIEDLVTLAKTRVTRQLTPEECRIFLHQQTCP